jgi:hypothetical protein
MTALRHTFIDKHTAPQTLKDFEILKPACPLRHAILRDDAWV